jgi:hypothetical protein
MLSASKALRTGPYNIICLGSRFDCRELYVQRYAGSHSQSATGIQFNKYYVYTTCIIYCFSKPIFTGLTPKRKNIENIEFLMLGPVNPIRDPDLVWPEVLSMALCSSIDGSDLSY